MKEVSWQNFMMMNAVIPTSKDDGGGAGSGSSPSSGTVSLFEIGQRLAEGKGV